MADQYLVVYPRMEEAASYYQKEAETLREFCTQMQSFNRSLVEEAWNGKTALAFEERFATDHAVAIGRVAEALDEISAYIRNYIANNQGMDDTGASGLAL